MSSALKQFSSLPIIHCLKNEK